MDTEELSMIHYYAMEAVDELLEDVRQRIFKANYHAEKVIVKDLENIEERLKSILDNFKMS